MPKWVVLLGVDVVENYMINAEKVVLVSDGKAAEDTMKNYLDENLGKVAVGFKIDEEVVRDEQ